MIRTNAPQVTASTSSSDSESDSWEFMPLQRRTRKALNISKPRESNIHGQTNPSESLEDLQRQLSEALSELERVLMEERFWERYSDYFTNRGITVIRAYGIGSPSNSKASCFQLALLILLKRHLKCERTLFYDPVMTSVDKAILTEHDIVGEFRDSFTSCHENDCGGVLFYMPHCDRELYEEIFANRLLGCHKDSFFIANHFTNYTLTNPSWELAVDLLGKEPLMVYTKDFERYKSDPSRRNSRKTAEKSATIPFNAFSDLAFSTWVSEESDRLVSLFHR